jgi:hypothetical protein
MSQQPSQAGAKFDLRQQMPETSKWVDAKRVELGKEYVNDCIRRALKGEPGLFYALERGHVLGTPYPATHPIADSQNYAITMGCSFAGFIATPATQGGSNGAN